MKNTICHVEIPIGDKNQASEFYKAVLNWDIDYKRIPNYGYALDNADISIGFPLLDEFEKTNLKFYIEVEEITKTLENVKSLGGKIVSEKQQITEEIGYAARFEDCFGNQIGLFSKK
ncbi:MAG: hypothetical protein HeimC3_07170 [Candidatus Heimdallarchaeota archaeon LC_3]|nr:MAG: hypothetical protein HeimC3_07170 [Candidatus Heimdallarchaeota archaeon LC_3]